MEGEAAPWWYGVAYYSPYSDHTICYPVPINLIVRAARAIWWALRRGKKDALAKAYDAGKAESFKGEQEAIDAIMRLNERGQTGKDG